MKKIWWFILGFLFWATGLMATVKDVFAFYAEKEARSSIDWVSYLIWAAILLIIFVPLYLWFRPEKTDKKKNSH